MQLGVMHQVAPDDLSATLAEMGLAPHFLAPDSQDQGDSPSRAPHHNRQRRRTSRAAGRVDQSLFCDETRPFFARITRPNASA